MSEMEKVEYAFFMKHTILITGANRGLGLELARQLLNKGHRVFALNRGTSHEVEALGAAFPEDFYIVRGDATHGEQLTKAKKVVLGQVKSLDILINNAAVHLEQDGTGLEDMDFDAVSRTFEVNTIGPLKVTQAFMPLLLEGSKRLLVNISSDAGSVSGCWRTREFGYAMSKAALNMQSKILQNRFGELGLKVLALHPGWVRTDMGGGSADLSPEESASGLVQLMLRDWSVDDPMYMDYTGKVMGW